MSRSAKQTIQAMPSQSLLAMKLAFGIRAKYMTLLGLMLCMVIQLAGVSIFSGKAISEEAPGTNPWVTITSPSSGEYLNFSQDSLEVTGTGPPNRPITVYVDGQQKGTVITNGSGNWEYVVNGLTSGNHTIAAKWLPAKDLAFIPYADSVAQTTKVNMIDTATGSVMRTIALPAYSNGLAATLNHAGTKAYITGYNVNTSVAHIWEINVATGQMTRQLVSNNPTSLFGALTIAANDQEGYILELNSASSSDRTAIVKKINLTDLSLAATLTILNPVNMSSVPSYFKPLAYSAALANNTLYSAISITDDADPQTASIINPDDNTVTSLPILDDPRDSNSLPLVTQAGNSVYFLSNEQLIEVDPQTNTITKQIELDSQPYTRRTLSIDAQHQKAYTATEESLHITDLTNETTEAIAIPTPTTSALSSQLSSDTTRLYIMTLNRGIKVFDTVNEEFVENEYIPISPGTITAFSLGRFVGQTSAPGDSVSITIDTEGAIDDEPTDNPEAFEDPDITDVTPQTEAGTAARRSSPLRAPQIITASQNSLFALAKRIPEPIAIGFPWLLLLLALILVSIQYYQVHSEAIATKRMQASVEHQKQLVEEQNNFVALSTHYLHTPLTVMEGEISLMVKAGTITQAQATRLQSTLSSLSNEAEAVLAQEEKNELDA